jgi:hypothetical protein
MTYEQAEQIAIEAGALLPQSMSERIALNIEKNNNWFFQWSSTPRAQGRLQAWTEAVLNGVPAHDLKRRVG